MISYLNSEYADSGSLSINPDDRGFLLADGLYEVVRFYRGRPFELAAHRKRLERGARALRFPRTAFPEFEQVLDELVKRNGLAAEDSATVYFQATRGVAPRRHAFPPSDTPLTTYGFAKKFSRYQREIDEGAKAVCVEDERWARCDVKSIALLANSLAHQTARDAGAFEAFFIRNGELQEGTHSNVMLCRGGTVRTAPLSNTLLAGVTRARVLGLCRDLDVPCAESVITREELLAADEVFIVGTTVEITPIVQVGETLIGDGRPGRLTRRLQERFFRLVDGQAGG